MPEGNDHKIWDVAKATKKAAFKLIMKEFKTLKRSAPEIEKTGNKLKSDEC